ncbi:MAG: zinc-ribbon domain-containing protein [Lachnospiraceae bacterium]|nr:zinc-ribbon domain-containing protein [Lachnospiraceae bacterium]
MDFFSKLGDKISNTSKDVAKKAKEVAEIANLNSQVTTKESTIKSTYVEIGKYVYENLKEDAPAEIAEKFAAIDGLMAEIAEMKKTIQELKGVQVCPSCGKDVETGAAFCPGCGNKMPEPVVEEVAAEEAPVEVAQEAPVEEAPAAEETTAE